MLLKTDCRCDTI